MNWRLHETITPLVSVAHRPGATRLDRGGTTSGLIGARGPGSMGPAPVMQARYVLLHTGGVDLVRGGAEPVLSREFNGSLVIPAGGAERWRVGESSGFGVRDFCVHLYAFFVALVHAARLAFLSEGQCTEFDALVQLVRRHHDLPVPALCCSHARLSSTDIRPGSEWPRHSARALLAGHSDVTDAAGPGWVASLSHERDYVGRSEIGLSYWAGR